VTYEMEGARVRIPALDDSTDEGIVRRYYPVTEQYLVHITGTRSMVWISTSDVEVLG
jgi:hypothetical protein